MPHKCTKCKKIYSNKEKNIILNGCECGSKRFFYVKHGQVKNAESAKEKRVVSLAPETEQKKKEDVNDSVAARNVDDSNLSVDIDDSLQNKLSVSELEEGKYAIDIGSIIPNGKKK